MEPPPDLASLSLADVARLAGERSLPPVAQWNPTHCGDSDMRIARDGTWFHMGSPIGRQEMVRLFSTILRREPDGGYVLVTPVEKLDIAVEDAPFVAVEMKAEGVGRDAALAFRLNTGELVAADAEHALRFEHGADGRLGGLPPVARVLLCPAWPGRAQGVLRRGAGEDLAALVNEQRLGAGRADINSKQGHGGRLQEAP